MKKFLLALLFAGSSLLVVSADSYSGPYCYEPISRTNKNSDDPQVRDEENIRGTCKQIEFAQFYELDPSIRNNYFFLIYNESEEPSIEFIATSSTNIQDWSRGSKYGSTDYYLAHKDEGDYCYAELSRYFNKGSLSMDNANYSDVRSLISNCFTAPRFIRLENIFNFDRIESPESKSYKQNGPGNLVSVTSPLAGYKEYWVIKKAPSGNMYRENVKSEELLDDGSIKTLPTVPPVSTLTETSAGSKWFFSKLLSFFLNLF